MSHFKYILIVVLFFFACEDAEFTNPLDSENNPDFIEPDTYILTDLDNSIQSEDNLVIEWIGNDFVSDYSYNFNNQGWSEWSDQNSLSLSYLDEGIYTFEVKGRYITLIEDISPAIVTFEVDAVNGPGLRIFPLYKNISPDDNMISLYLEEVQNISFGTISISIQSNDCITRFNIESIQLGDLFVENSNIFIHDSMQQESIINFGLTDIEGLSGTGELAKIYIGNDNSGCGGPVDLVINLESSQLRDYDDNEILILDSANGVVDQDE
tara:strand:- start:48 stop:848 length:801 start_codon:yes stop_codon:yes gene_type:complete